MKRKKILAIFVLILAVFAFLLSRVIISPEEGEIISEEINAENDTMRVNFYTIDREAMGRGEYVGYAELVEDELTVEVTDSELENLLNEPYTVMAGEMGENGVIRDYEVTHPPGSAEHLRSIASEAWKHGYISEKID